METLELMTHLVGVMNSLGKPKEQKTAATDKEDPPFVNPGHPDAIPPQDPNDPRIVHPTGEFGPKSYIDLGAYSPANYPTFTDKKN